MRAVILILMLSGGMFSGSIYAQKDPPSPPPPPKTSSYDNSRLDDLKKEEEYRKKMMEAEKARQKAMDEAKKKSMEKEKAFGFQSLRIATFGNYQLGMTSKEYDSLSKLGDLKIKTDNESYSVILKPSFTDGRLTGLVLESKSDKEKLNDFMSMIALEYRDPDSIVNSSQEEQQKILNSEWYWKNKLHTMTIKMSRELKDGISKGNFIIKFEGNKDYFDLLKSLDKLGD